MMDIDSFVEKVDNDMLTIKEAFEFVGNNPNSTDGQKKAAKTLLKNLDYKNLNAPYFSSYKSDDYIKSVGIKGQPNNKWSAHSNFETGLQQGLIRTKYSNYEKLAGSSGFAAKALGKEKVGTQDRILNPMRGTIYSVDMDEMYSRHLSNNSYILLDEKTGNPKINKKTNEPIRIAISQDTKDYMQYEKITGQRLETNIGSDGIRLSDVSVTTKKDGSVVVEISEKQTKTKLRPRITYEGEAAVFLKDLVNKAKKRGGNKSPKDIPLFNATVSEVNGVWNNLFRPEIEKRFPNQLPVGEKATPKVIRKILARQLEDEFNVANDLVDSWIGHSGGAEEVRLSTKAYAGTVSDKRIGSLLNNLIRNDAYNNGVDVNNIFIMRGAADDSSFVVGNQTYPANTSEYDYLTNEGIKPNPTIRTKEEIETSNQLQKTLKSKYELEEQQYKGQTLTQVQENQKLATKITEDQPEVDKIIAEKKQVSKQKNLAEKKAIADEITENNKKQNDALSKKMGNTKLYGKFLGIGSFVWGASYIPEDYSEAYAANVKAMKDDKDSWRKTVSDILSPKVAAGAEAGAYFLDPGIDMLNQLKNVDKIESMPVITPSSQWGLEKENYGMLPPKHDLHRIADEEQEVGSEMMRKYKQQSALSQMKEDTRKKQIEHQEQIKDFRSKAEDKNQLSLDEQINEMLLQRR